MKAEKVTPQDKTEFYRLRGDSTEQVRLATGRYINYMGDYVFERVSGDGKNKFFRRDPESNLVQVVECNTDNMQFDRQRSEIRLGSLFGMTRMESLKEGEEYNSLRAKLTALGEWK